MNDSPSTEPRASDRSRSTRWVGAVGAAVAVLVTLPSITVGLVGDDYLHRAFLRAHLTHAPGAMGLWYNLFYFNTPVKTEISLGGLPWWTSLHYHVSLLRPLSTLSQYLDYALWPEHPAWMHVHNMLLFALIVAVAASIYQRLLSPRAAWLATLLYASDDAHMLGTAWVASRNTLLTALFTLISLSCFIRSRSRTTAARGTLALGVASLLAAHASSEGALAIWGDLLAYALFVDEAPALARARALAPYAVVSVVWMSMSTALGYGAHGSGVYIDPRAAPLAYLQAVIERMPTLLVAQFGIAVELRELLPKWFCDVVMLTAIGVLALGALFTFARWRTQPVLRFFALGTLAALLPICAVGVVGRVLFVSGFGAHGLVAALLATWLWRDRSKASAPAPWTRALAFWIVTVHVATAAAAAPAAPAWWRHMHRSFYRAALSLPHGKALGNCMIMVLNAPDYLRMPFVLMYHRLFATPGPPIAHLLGSGAEGMHVYRVDQEQLDVSAADGILDEPTAWLVRPRDEPFHVHQVSELFGAWVRVEALAHDGKPTKIRIGTFGLDDPRLLWVTWNGKTQRFDEVLMPEIGKSVALPDAVVP